MSFLAIDQVAAAVPAPALEALPDQRYRGDSLTVSVHDLHPDDVAVVRRVYDLLLEVKLAAGRHLDSSAEGLDVIRAILKRGEFDQVPSLVATLGSRLHADRLSHEVRQTYHDVRGGSLMALLMHLDMIAEWEAEVGDLERVFILARDHLKMMRNALQDLDEERYNADLNEKAHSVDLLREKWSNTQYRARGGEARVDIDCSFTGTISERCMEFSALDRVIYNLVNNASEHASDGSVRLSVHPVRTSAGGFVRFAVMNHVTPGQVRALRERFGDDLGQLFRGGFTTGGNGIGLRICGDLVSHGFERPSLSKALSEHLLGATLVDELFVSWFYWPASELAAAPGEAA